MITVDSFTRVLSSHHVFLHPAAYALGFLDCEDISARCMLTIFQFFATKTDASKLRMLSGSPAERLLKPITDYVEEKGGRLHIRWGCRCLPTCSC
jgi:zeta-carotene desaturase